MCTTVLQQKRKSLIKKQHSKQPHSNNETLKEVLPYHEDERYSDVSNEDSSCDSER